MASELAPQRPAVAEDDTTTLPAAAQFVDEELLVEEISIDGMCGVY